MRLRTRILIAIFATLLVGDVLGTAIVRARFLEGAQREAANQARARAQQVQALYAERAATLAAESEAVSLYPAVIQALVDNNPVPFKRWSGQLANLQGTSITVVDASAHVVARGHAPDFTGDDLSGMLGGLASALEGDRTSGAEPGDELGLAVRGYAPVKKDGVSGAILGAVMIADRVDDGFLDRMSSGDSALHMRLGSLPATDQAVCDPPTGVSASCTVPLLSPTGQPVSSLVFDVPLADVERAQADAERGLWLASGIVLLLGAAAAWFLARSLTEPLARLTRASERIAGGDLLQPVSAGGGGGAELGLLARAFETMRARVAEMTGTLRDERDVLDAVLESEGDGILMVDLQGAPVVANSAWIDLVGAPTLDAAAGLVRLSSDLEAGPRRADGNSDTELFSTTAARWIADPEHVGTADFERAEPYQRFRLYSAPVRHHGGAMLGRILVLRDVTRETEAERMRAALVATVSHELRSPLTAITGYTDTLLHDGPWDAQTEREFLEVVSLSAGRLSALVDNLLDAATLEAGALRLQREPVRLERIVERVLAQRRLLAGGCSLELVAPARLPLADADPLRVEQVLANLVDNAIKYAPQGDAIRVSISSDDAELIVRVSDHGPGIPTQSRAHLFERFYRVESTRSVKGVGLGLYICRSLVESHGGRIWVDSEPGHGSTFGFTLPALSVTADELTPRERELQPV